MKREQKKTMAEHHTPRAKLGVQDKRCHKRLWEIMVMKREKTMEWIKDLPIEVAECFFEFLSCEESL